MKVLVVDDEIAHCRYIADVLRTWGHEVQEALDGREALRVASSQSVDVLITDLMMPRMDGFELLRTLAAEGPLPPSIVMTAFGSIEKAIETIHDLGGFWFLEKPVDISALQALLARAGAQSRLAAENLQLRRELASRGVLGNLIGRSAPMMLLFDLIRQVAPTSAPVLITGESGTGKELVARAIHENSRRSSGPFVALNCAAMPETLIESELFGHEKGAFTGAVERRIGALEAARGGTFFLDELGEMPMPVQAKLLRFLEDFQFRRLGSRTEMKADVRILAATNRETMKAIEEGKLREDLYYRINVFHIALPPLRDRKEDIPLIVESMIHTFNARHDSRVTHAGPEFLAMLQERNWEGNVRELRNVIERAVILAGEGPLRMPRGTFPVAGDPVAPDPARQSQEDPAAASPVKDGPPSLPVRVGMTVGEAERVLIEATLAHTGMNKTRAADLLDISAKTLHTRLRLYYPSPDPADSAEEMAATVGRL